MAVIARMLAILGAVALGLGAGLFLLLQGLLCFDSCPSNVTLSEIQFAVETLGPGILLATGAWILARFAGSDAGDTVWRRRLNEALLAAVVALVVAVGAPSVAIAAHAYSSLVLGVILAAGLVLVAWPLVTLVASFRISSQTKADGKVDDDAPATSTP
jgi:hypothetical protein